jgi:hypothetical protein
MEKTDDREPKIHLIETHLRKLGLTEEQISLHLAPLRATKLAPKSRKAGRVNTNISYFMRPSRKPLIIS